MDETAELWRYAVAHPIDGFVEMCAPMADTDLGGDIVTALAQLAIAARVEPYALRGLRTEHGEPAGPSSSADALVIDLGVDRWIFGHPAQDRRAYEHVGFVRIDETTLYGAHDFNIWDNDDGRFESARAHPLSRLDDSARCVLEVSDREWIVESEFESQLLVATITTTDPYLRRIGGPREADYYVLPVPTRTPGEHLLRLGLASWCGASTALALCDDRVIARLLPGDERPAISVRDLLEHEVPKVLAANRCDVRGLQVVQLDIDGESWTIDVGSGRVREGTDPAAERLSASADALIDAYLGTRDVNLFHTLARMDENKERLSFVQKVCRLFR